MASPVASLKPQSYLCSAVLIVLAFSSHVLAVASPFPSEQDRVLSL